MEHRAAGARLGRSGRIGAVLDVESHVPLKERELRITESAARERKHDVRGGSHRYTARDDKSRGFGECIAPNVESS